MKKYTSVLVVLLFLIVSANLPLISPVIASSVMWSHIYKRNSQDCLYDMVTTSDGGYALTGYTWTPLYFWLVKTDKFGNEEWDKTYGSPDGEVATALIQTSDGGYALVGYSYRYGKSLFLVKTDANGRMEWNQIHKGNGAAVGNSLIETPDGGYAIAGRTKSLDGVSDEFWLIKTDSYGDILWNQTYGGTSGDSANELIQTEDGGYVLVGSTGSFGAGESDFWLVKVDSEGNMEWNQTYGGIESDTANALISTSDGGYALAGTKHFRDGNNNDFMLVKTDEYGFIPEFPSWIILPLFLMVTLSAIIVKKRLFRPHP